MERSSTADLDDSSKYSNRGIFLFALRTVVGKGSVSTVFVHGLVGPNLSVNARKLASGSRAGFIRPGIAH